MKLFKITFLLAIICLVHCNAMPTDSAYEEEYPELTAGLFEGDMDIEMPRNGLIDATKRWPNKIVRYKFGPNFDTQRIIQILQCMKIIESLSCVRYLPASDTATAYLKITGAATGCHSNVGYTGNVQILNLEFNEGCFRNGSILHELLHTLGFYHEHSATDRDDYIKIVRENIIDGRERHFNKLDASVITDFGVGYDYDSIMHYGRRVFSKNGLDTIVPLGENIQIGQRRGLSEKDTIKLNKMYKCNV